MDSPIVPGRIGMVTVLYRSERVLPEFLGCVAAQTHRDFIGFAVDNASGDGSAAFCREHGLRVIGNDDNRGVAAANNQGIAAALEAGCEYVLLLNNDVRFGPELFALLLDGARTHGCEMTTPVMYLYSQPQTVWCAGGGFQHWLGERPRHYGEGKHDTGQFIGDRRVEFTPTCCVLIHRDVFAHIGMMDEHYFVYWDDTDFMLRAQRAGVKLYLLAQAKLWHHVGASSNEDFTVRYATRNHAYYLRKHLPAPLAALWCALYAAVFAAGAPFLRRLRLKLGAWLEGLRMPVD